MGLDILYLSDLKFSSFSSIRTHDKDIYICVNPYFKKQADNIETGFYSEYGLIGSFNAGSYSGFNIWRSRLARMVNTSDKEIWSNPNAEGPFVELINFSDCEGVIGSKTSFKLSSDFYDWDDKAYEISNTFLGGDFWYSKYKSWKKAFDTASHSGCVIFH